ncbi:MAG TPA: hypothetical protein VGS19_19745 [Streptosporangiaceae bacterium]|nr:hypothetical protein [Streptosporangiaceae bacterium]
MPDSGYGMGDPAMASYPGLQGPPRTSPPGAPANPLYHAAPPAETARLRGPAANSGGPGQMTPQMGHSGPTLTQSRDAGPAGQPMQPGQHVPRAYQPVMPGPTDGLGTMPDQRHGPQMPPPNPPAPAGGYIGPGYVPYQGQPAPGTAAVPQHTTPHGMSQHTVVQQARPQPPGPGAVGVSVADAVQAAHGEGFQFGQVVARDAPALWLEAVLARKPRMPSDLEARLLQDSSLPIDSLLHDEVRHALRRGFWDALERSRA